MKTRLFITMGVQMEPWGAVQITFCFLAMENLSGRSRSRETPFCSGPRQNAQSFVPRACPGGREVGGLEAAEAPAVHPNRMSSREMVRRMELDSRWVAGRGGQGGR
jgi:hypothetical protein